MVTAVHDDGFSSAALELAWRAVDVWETVFVGSAMSPGIIMPYEGVRGSYAAVNFSSEDLSFSSIGKRSTLPSDVPSSGRRLLIGGQRYLPKIRHGDGTFVGLAGWVIPVSQSTQ